MYHVTVCYLLFPVINYLGLVRYRQPRRFETTSMLRTCVDLTHYLSNCPCPEGYAQCEVNPCLDADCPSHPGATCEVSLCGQCEARWFVAGRQVHCHDVGRYNISLSLSPPTPAPPVRSVSVDSARHAGSWQGDRSTVMMWVGITLACLCPLPPWRHLWGQSLWTVWGTLVRGRETGQLSWCG